MGGRITIPNLHTALPVRCQKRKLLKFNHFMFFDNSEAKIKKRIKKANALFDNFKREESVQEFLKLQQEFPKNTDIMFAFAVVQNSMRQEALAIDTLKNILKINESHTDTLLILPAVIYEYAVRLSETGEKESARNYLLDFIALENENKADLANGYKELAVIEESMGNIDDAKKFIETAIFINHKDKDAYSGTYSDYFKEILNRLSCS
ncbi:MAG: hypothetical protein QM791_02240 [Ferruginibacter sp.]